MRLLIAAALLMSPVATPVLANAHMEKVARLTIDTPIETLMSDPAAKTVVDTNFPGLATHPMYEQIKTLSLAQVAPMSDGKMTEAAMAKTKAELAAIK